MAELDINKATTTNFENNVKSVTISPSHIDAGGENKEISWSFPNAGEYLGYYQTIPELQSSLTILAFRVAGLGYEVQDSDRVILENITGWGEDSFDQIMRMLIIEKKVFGDSFAEIVRNDKGTLINIKKLYTGDMKIILNEQGIIERYEQLSHIPDGKPKKFEPSKILHLCNNRIGNQIHGTSIIPVLKKILNAKNQALEDEVMIRHRDKAIGIAYYDTDDAGKISYANTQIENAVNKGEMLGLPKDTITIAEFPNKSPADRIQWLQYLDNLFYQVVGIPKVLVTSEGYTEAGGKAGLLSFEPVELAEKRELEQDLWNQLAIRIKFARSPSLLGEAVGTEQKNAGQTGMQKSETEVRPTRTE